MKSWWTYMLRILVLLLLWCDRTGSSLKWLALYRTKQKGFNHRTHCNKARSDGLVSRQVKLCKNNLDIMPTIVDATYVSVDTCISQFSNMRWNCSTAILAPKFSRDLKRGTREQAYVYAISSAALVHSVARACSIGVTTKCSCGALPTSAPEGDYTWGGCGDDVQFGEFFSKVFTEAALMKKDQPKKGKRANMNRHNNKAGRRATLLSLMTACKCHGVSGSCSIKTCWKSIPPFQEIGQNLRKQYAFAVEVAYKRVNKQKQFMPLNQNHRHVGEEELIYFQKSPDYCNPDQKTGSVGTHGRLCDQDSRGSGGCQSMCCGRGFISFTKEVVERCECKYYWCCYVKCKTCVKTLHLSRCR